MESHLSPWGLICLLINKWLLSMVLSRILPTLTVVFLALEVPSPSCKSSHSPSSFSLCESRWQSYVPWEYASSSPLCGSRKKGRKRTLKMSFIREETGLFEGRNVLFEGPESTDIQGEAFDSLAPGLSLSQVLQGQPFRSHDTWVEKAGGCLRH